VLEAKEDRQRSQDLLRELQDTAPAKAITGSKPGILSLWLGEGEPGPSEDAAVAAPASASLGTKIGPPPDDADSVVNIEGPENTDWLRRAR
jgi:hypothetical protein